MKVYFVATDNKSSENIVISEVKPDNLLCSYFYFRTKKLKDFCDRLGYKPQIMLDSGAYSAWTTGKNISLIDYMKYIEENKEYIEKYIALDVIADADMTFDYYKIMRKKGFKPIPVYHYGADEKYLRKYILDGNEYIALGETVPIKNKGIVARWINLLTYKYPNVKFHLLGSSSTQITQMCDIYSCDSSTWILQAINGIPRHIMGKSRGAKIQRAKYNMENTMKVSQYKQIKMII